MFKIPHYFFVVFSILSLKNYSADIPTVSDTNQNNESNSILSNTSTIDLIPHITAFNSMLSDAGTKTEFKTLIDPTTREIFYQPKTKEALEQLIDKIHFSESIYTQTRASNQEQVPNHIFLYTPEIYLPFFRKALDKITKTQLISEINLRDILYYLASLQDFSAMPDIWDTIKDSLGILYDFKFTEGCLSIDFSLARATAEDWMEDTIADVANECKLATNLSFKLDLNKSNPKFRDLDEKAKTYKNKAINPFAASQEYIAMLRSADSLYQLLIDNYLASQEYLTKFKNKFEAKYGVNFEPITNHQSTKLDVFAELIRILSREDDLSDILLSVQENDEYTFDCDSTLEKYCAKKTARYRRRDTSIEYTRKINIIESKIANYRANILFERAARKNQPCKHEADHIFILLDEIREFQKTKQEIDSLDTQIKPAPPNKTKKITDEERAIALNKSLIAMGIACDKPTNKQKRSAIDKSKDDDEFKSFLEEEKKRAKQGIRSDASSKAQMIANSRSKAASNYPKATNTYQAMVAGNPAAATSSRTAPKKASNVLLSLFNKRNQENINFYDTLQAQSKSLADATLFEFEFFHQAEQPQYTSFKNSLISHGFKVIGHGEKDHFCWKVNSRFYHVAVDRAHGSQAEKGKAAGWWLKTQQAINKSGLIATH